MRWMILGAAALLLCACGQLGRTAPMSSSSGDACVRIATHQVTWSEPSVADTVIVRSEGPSCEQAVVTLVVRNADGAPLWTFISTHHNMTIGGVTHGDAPRVSQGQVDQFLASWANVTAQMTNQLPEWRAGAESVGSNGGLNYTTALSRDTYEAMRQHNLRMVCYAASVDATQCLVVDPSSHAPVLIAAYGP